MKTALAICMAIGIVFWVPSPAPAAEGAGESGALSPSPPPQGPPQAAPPARTAAIAGTAFSAPAAVFRQANALYAQEKYADAANLYESILKTGRESAPLYYNLGNACFKQGELGRAILNYRRAWNLSPRDPEISKNLEYAQEYLKDDISALPLGFWGRLKLLIIAHLPAGTWFRLTSLIYGLTALWILSILLIPPLKRAAAPVLKTLAIMLAVSVLGSLLAYSYYRVPRAIVLEPQVEARYGPQEKDAVAFELHEGTEVRVIRRAGAWSQIALPDGKSGWLPATSLEII